MDARWLMRAALAMTLACWMAGNCLADRWTPPDIRPTPAQLAMLSGPIDVDGKLDEWAGAACVPIRSRTDIYWMKEGLEWNGPGDAGMEVYCAWHETGLCLAAVVSDDLVRNDRPDEKIYEADCVELYMDGRVGEQFMEEPYSKGAYGISVGPTADAKGFRFVVGAKPGETLGVRAAGTIGESGYVVEVLVPWSAFPGLEPKEGARIALGFTLDDDDYEDGVGDQELTLSYRSTPNMWRQPQNLVEWEFVKEMPTGEDVLLGPMVELSMPKASLGEGPLGLSLEMGKELRAQAASVRFTVTGPGGSTTFEEKAEVEPAAAPWGESGHAGLEWQPTGKVDGFCTVSATICDQGGRPLGTATSPVLMAGATAQESLERMAAADIAGLSRVQPFRAAAYLGAGACYERLKRGAETGNLTTTAQAAREVTARLDVLEQRDAALADAGLCDLLALAADPEAQVVVEYPEWGEETGKVAFVTFYWGAVPLVSAMVREHRSEEEAREALEPEPSWIVEPSEEATLDALPARVTLGRHNREPFQLARFDPDRHVFVARSRRMMGHVAGLEQLPDLRADTAAVLDGCPEGIRVAVEAWAAQNSVPLVGLEEALTEERALLAGDLRSCEAWDTFAGWEMLAPVFSPVPIRLQVAAGTRTLWAEAPTREVAELAARMVIAGKPVSLPEVDELRLALVETLASATEPAARPGLFFGDIHMHTFYSDGTPSPVGLALQAMYCYQDFSVMTDHDTLDGALVAMKLLGRHGFAHPLIVGDEITTGEWHFNAYPVRELVAHGQPDEMIDAAHAQGAVIQWNHPGYPMPRSEWTWECIDNALTGSGLDAWEHVPARYEEWRAAGRLPMIVGSTDTHSGTFGSGERTMVLAPGTRGEEVAEAIGSGKAAAVASDGKLFYGSEAMVTIAWAALAEADALKAAAARHIREALKGADLAALLANAPPRVVTVEEIAEQ